MPAAAEEAVATSLSALIRWARRNWLRADLYREAAFQSPVTDISHGISTL